MQPKTLVDTLAATLSEMDVKTIGDTAVWRQGVWSKDWLLS